MFIVRESYIKRLIRLVEESKIESLEVSTWGRKVKITQPSKNSTNGSSQHPAVLDNQVIVAASSMQPAQTVAYGPGPAPVAPAVPPVPDTGKLVTIKSPMVGTYYAAPSPDADPYVSVNQKITPGQVVCIVEAMKLMNEIESEYGGQVVKILVENAKPVEFGQDLFLVEPE